MGVFGVQLVVTMIVASFLHKIVPYYSFGRWLITKGMKRYLPPSDDLLRPHVTMTTSSSTNNKGTKRKYANQHRNATSPEYDLDSNYLKQNRIDPNLALQKSANIKLEEVSVEPTTLLLLHYSSELEWLLNFTLASVIIYLATSIYYYLRPAAAATEYNLSVIWLLLVCGYTLVVLVSLTKVYLSDELSAQRSVGIVFTMLFFVSALVILLVDESVLDFGLEKSHSDISKTISRLLEGHIEDVDDFQFIPLWMFKMIIAFLSTLLSVTLIFPGFRFADTHFEAIRRTNSVLLKSLLHLCYIAPMFCLSLWIRPLTHDMIAERDNVNFFGLFEMTYKSFRFAMLIWVCMLRLLLFRTYLQTYLNMAKWRVELLRSEAGRITISNLRKKVSDIFLFYSALGVQYIAPYIILLCATLLLGVSSVSHDINSVTRSDSSDHGDVNNLFRFSGFGCSILHGCFAFVCWWVCLTNAVTYGFGAILREYLIM